MCEHGNVKHSLLPFVRCVSPVMMMMAGVVLRSLPSRHCLVCSRLVAPISEEDWLRCSQRYGPGSRLTSLEPCTHCAVRYHDRPRLLCRCPCVVNDVSVHRMKQRH